MPLRKGNPLRQLIPVALCGLIVFACGAAAQAPAPAAAPQAEAQTAPDAIVLSVGDQKLTKQQFEDLIRALPPQLQGAAQGPQRREFALQIAELIAVAGEAEQRKMHERSDISMRLRYQRENILAGALYQEMVEKATVSEEAIREAYDRNKEAFEQATAKHILLRFKGSRVPAREGKPELSEDEARAKAAALKQRISAGASFDDVAKEESDDTGSAQTGGSLGTFSRGQMIPAFEEAAFTQPIGVVGDPVRTDFGYHLILVESRNTKTLDEVRAELERELKPQVAREQLKALAESKSITLDEKYFAPPPTPEITLDAGRPQQ